MTELLATQPQPQDERAEISLIGALLIDGEAGRRVKDTELLPEHFYQPRHRIIMTAIYALMANKMPIDLTILAAWLNDHAQLEEIGGTLTLTTIMSNTPSSAGAVHYAARVKACAYRRGLIRTANEIIYAAYDMEHPLEDVRHEAETSIIAVGQTLATSEQLPEIGTIALAVAREKVEEATSGKSSGMKTGLHGIDHMIRTGFKRKRFVVIAGRPGSGKTALGLDIADAFARQGYAVMIASEEMSKEALMARGIKRFLPTEYLECFEDPIAAHNAGANYTIALSDAAAKYDNLPIQIDDTPTNLHQLESRVRQSKQYWRDRGKDMACVVVDYLQLVKTSARVKREEAVAELSRGMKEIAKANNVCLIGLSQLSRLCEARSPRRPEPSDMRESGQIEQDADIILACYRPGMYGKKEYLATRMHPDIHHDYAEVICLKQREGPAPRTGYFHFDAEKTHFKDLTTGEWHALQNYMHDVKKVDPTGA